MIPVAELEAIIVDVVRAAMPLGADLVTAIEVLIRAKHPDLLAAPPADQEAAIEAEDAAAIAQRWPAPLTPATRAELPTLPGAKS